MQRSSLMRKLRKSFFLVTDYPTVTPLVLPVMSQVPTARAPIAAQATESGLLPERLPVEIPRPSASR